MRLEVNTALLLIRQLTMTYSVCLDMALLDEYQQRVPSLFKTCTQAVVKSLSQHEDDLSSAPIPIRHACLNLISKRGLITDDNIAKLVTDRLTSLDLSSCVVTDQCLFKLSACRNLRKVDLNATKDSNQAITSEGLIRLSHSCHLLQIVYLRRCITLTDEGIIALSHNCRQLRELNVGGCSLLTDQSLIALGQHSSCLTSFNFSSAAVTDNGVYSLVSGLCSASLKEIDMSHCQQLSDESVEAIVHCCPQIRILIFHRCPLITAGARVALEELMLQNGTNKMTQVTFTVY